MNIQETIAEIRNCLVETFSMIDSWFDKDSGLRNYKPDDGGWTINEILEHIGRVSHFLLILIDKGTDKALRNIHNLDLQAELENYKFHRDELAEVGQHKSYEWHRPEHMKPTGDESMRAVRQQLKDQLNHCLNDLERLKMVKASFTKQQ